MTFGGKPQTKADRARFAAIRGIGCIVCRAAGAAYRVECQIHHLKSGNVRRGHQFTVGLCPWHHMAAPFAFHTHAECRIAYGPSLAEGVKPFREYIRTLGIGDGSDDAMLEHQNTLLDSDRIIMETHL
jgi:hypothetical protein